MKWLCLLLAVWLAAADAAVVQQRGFFVDEDHENSGARTLKLFTENNTINVGNLGRRAVGETFKWKPMRAHETSLYPDYVTVVSEGSVDLEFKSCMGFGQWSAIPTNLLISKGDYNTAVSERYWLSSRGSFFYVYPETPLFMKHSPYADSYICFIANVTAPYSSKRSRNVLKYDFWVLENAKEAHLRAVDKYLGKPSGIPDQRMIQYPVWSTGVKYSKDIDRDSLWAFANEIKDNGFQNAQIQIDDRWETCYGSLAVDNAKLSNFKELIQDIKSLGFRVSLWVHPFINKNCDPWYTEALEKGYLVLNEEGSPDTTWRNSDDSGAGYIDFTSPEAAEWFATRLQGLIDTYDIDTFSFDAGESSWSPQISVQTGDVEEHPSHIVSSYVRTAARFGSAVKVRSGMRTQDLSIFTSMDTQNSNWYHEKNSLAALIPSVLQMNLNGYTLVSPGAIAGNGTNRGPPSKELFIRWLQANVFMPTLQFSLVPWDYDQETVEICRRYTELHASIASNITAAMEASVLFGTPVNPPIWWVDPKDQQTFTITDEYLLGSDILVAPVLTLYATTRDIYLPKGTWYEGGDPTKFHQGPVWLRKFPAPLDVLPYFVKSDRTVELENAASTPGISVVLVLLVTACVSYVW